MYPIHSHPRIARTNPITRILHNDIFDVADFALLRRAAFNLGRQFKLTRRVTNTMGPLALFSIGKPGRGEARPNLTLQRAPPSLEKTRRRRKRLTNLVQLLWDCQRNDYFMRCFSSLFFIWPCLKWALSIFLPFFFFSFFPPPLSCLMRPSLSNFLFPLPSFFFFSLF